MDSSRGSDRGRTVETLDETVRHALELVTNDLLDEGSERAFEAATVGVFRTVVSEFATARDRDEPPFAAGVEFEAERALLDGLSSGVFHRVERAVAEIDYDALAVRHLGRVYERLLDSEPVVTEDGMRLTGARSRRSTVGAYYTPKRVVEYTVSRALAGTRVGASARADARAVGPDAQTGANTRVLDPAMGCGRFLTSAIDQLAALRDEPERQARRKVAENGIFGVDVDPVAVELARSAVWLETGVWPDDNLQVGDTLADDGAAILDGRQYDAVIGNPPYVRSRHIPAETKTDLKERYDTAMGAFDLYVPFVERMIELGDRVACVVPNKWTTARYGRTLRNRLLDRHRLVELLDVSAVSVFEDASVYPLVLTVETGAGPAESIRVQQAGSLTDLNSATETTLLRSFVDSLGDRVIPVGIDPDFVPIAERLRQEHDGLDDHATLTEGIHTGNVREKLVVDDDCPECEKLVGGGDISRYGLEWGGEWVRFDPSLIGDDEYGGLRGREVFECEKLLLRDISARPVAAYDDEGFYALNTLYSVRPRADSDRSLRYLLAVINSTATACWFQQVYGGTHVSGGYLRLKPMFAGQLPVPTGEDERDALAVLADRMGDLKRERDAIEIPLPSADGPKLGDLVRPLGNSILTETTKTRDALRLGTVSVEERGQELVFSATARYRPDEGDTDDDGENGDEQIEDTDSWGFVETEPIPVLAFDADASLNASEMFDTDEGVEGREDRFDLLRWYVPRATSDGEFPERATKTISLRDRLESLRVPAPADATVFLERCRRAERLDEKLARTDAAIDRLVYRAYGLSVDEIEIVERLVE
ncbi:Eco57I restriction-modification methylase domain-containing protein [Haladaptatus sp. NG-SE-30]